MTLLTAHVSQNFSKQTSLIHYLSFLPYVVYCSAWLDMYVRQAIELRVLLGRVALVARRLIVIKLSRGRPVCLSSALWKNGGSDPDAVWHHRSDGSRDEAGSGVWGLVHGKGYFWGRIWARHCPQGPIGRTRAAAMRPSCQITLDRLVILLAKIVVILQIIFILIFLNSSL